jgi:probable F420-dependent oxidoreductase
MLAIEVDRGIRLVRAGERGAKSQATMFEVQIGIGVGQARWASGRRLSDAVAQLYEVAQAAEDLGLYSLWVGDHLLFPAEVDYTRSRYPMTPTGRLAIDTQSTMLEALTVLSALAGATRRVRLGTSVLVLPYRHPLLTAKVVATLDVLSKGRVILGVGVGWLREEFEALGAASFERRGALTDEYLRIFRHVWSAQEVDVAGRFYQFTGFGFQPHPVQPWLPIWIGGASDAALRRVARLGDGWHPSHIPPRVYAAQLERLREYLAAAGRSPGEVTLSINFQMVLDRQARGDELEYVPQAESSARFVGNPTAAAATLRQYAALGVTHAALNLSLLEEDGGEPRPPTEALEVLARDVLPLLASDHGRKGVLMQ